MSNEEAVAIGTSADRDVLSALGERPVVLVGLMGAGKTAVGRKLAARLGLPFVDADHEIERAASMPVPEIFAAYGEPEFRRLEASVMARLMTAGRQVIATGGGAFMNEATRSAIRSNGVSVWLSADLDLLMSRVLRKPTRPLLQNEDPRAVMKALMDLRYPVYAEADIRVESRDVSKDAMVEAVIEGLRRHLAVSSAPEGAQGENAEP